MKNNDFIIVFVDKNSCILINLDTQEMECIDDIIDDVMNIFGYNDYQKALNFIQLTFKNYIPNNKSTRLNKIANANVFCF